MKGIGVIHFTLVQKVQTGMKTCQHRNTDAERHTNTLSLQKKDKKYLKD